MTRGKSGPWGKASERHTGSLGGTWWPRAQGRQGAELSWLERSQRHRDSPTLPLDSPTEFHQSQQMSFLQDEPESLPWETDSFAFETLGLTFLKKEKKWGGGGRHGGRDPIYSNYSFHSPPNFIIWQIDSVCCAEKGRQGVYYATSCYSN